MRRAAIDPSHHHLLLSWSATAAASQPHPRGARSDKGTARVPVGEQASMHRQSGLHGWKLFPHHNAMGQRAHYRVIQECAQERDTQSRAGGEHSSANSDHERGGLIGYLA